MFIVPILILIFILAHVWLHITNPYAQWTIVRQPYTSRVVNGAVNVRRHFGLRVLHGWLAQLVGYYKNGFLIVQNTWFGSRPAASLRADAIITDIHRLRFDPDKPYLISGDQFSVLYVRNLGVFYNSLLDPATALNKKDRQARLRVYLQSALYALDAFTRAKKITTTIVPLGRRTVALTQVHPGSVASDSLYGLLYALNALRTQPETQQAASLIITQRLTDLGMLLDIYLRDVRSPATGLVKRGLKLAGARDGALRDSSFYDNVVLWKTLSLANDLGIQAYGKNELAHMRSVIINKFWLPKYGHFKDDLRRGVPAGKNYCSDWLIALPTGFLNPATTADRIYLQASVDFIRAQRIAMPFPIKYQTSNDNVDAPWAVRTFVPNYGGNAIWSYWGAQYITLLADLFRTTGEASYFTEAQHGIALYRHKIEATRGFPETFDAHGRFLQNAVYKSIRQTGWVVQFEQAEARLRGAKPAV